MYILSQVLVVIADILFVASMFTRKKSLLVALLFVSDIVFASHYLCLDGGLTGATTIFIDAVYLIVMFLLEKYNKTKFNLIPTILAMALTITFSVITWQGAISLLPMFSMLIYLTGMIFTNLVFVKSGALCRNILNIIYMFLIASYVGASLEICVAISTIVGLILTIKNARIKIHQIIWWFFILRVKPSFRSPQEILFGYASHSRFNANLYLLNGSTIS